MPSNMEGGERLEKCRDLVQLTPEILGLTKVC